MKRYLIIIAVVLVAFLTRSFWQSDTSVAWGQDKQAQPKPQRLEEWNRWVGAGSGKLTQAEVITKLGPPQAFALPDSEDYPRKLDTKADLMMVWREETFIEVELKEGRAIRVEGRINAALPRRKVTLENIQKLRLGMEEKDLFAVLGGPGAAQEPARRVSEIKNTVWRWGGKNELWVLLEKGVVCTVEYRGATSEK